MLPLIEKEIISVHGWLTPEQFIDIVAIAEMTPVPLPLIPPLSLATRQPGSGDPPLPPPAS